MAMGGLAISDFGVPRAARRPAEIRRMFVRECVRGRGFARWLVLAALEAVPPPPAPIGCCWRLGNHKSQRSVSTARVATLPMSSGSILRGVRNGAQFGRPLR